jgi:glucan phosphoethanolaminetransferase (alkaline phosphatase superfamily)
MVCAILSRRRKLASYDLITVLLTVNILVLVGMFFFEICTKYIPIFFVLILIANYINFMSFNLLIRHLRTPERADLQKRTNAFFITMNLGYLVCVGLAFTPTYGPRCKQPGSMYPECLTLAESLLVANSVYHVFLYYKGYYLQWEENPKWEEIKGKEFDLGFEPLNVLKPLFKT